MKKFEAKIENLRKKFDDALEKAGDERSLQELRHQFLSRKRGHITLLFEELKELPPGEKPAYGKLLNDLKDYVLGKLSEGPGTVSLSGKISGMASVKAEIGATPAVVKIEGIDLTLPGKNVSWGAPHPVMLFEQEIEDIFLAMGFSVAEGPEIETDYYNFGALNFPPHHPARDDWDTLYIGENLLLRTHTSPMQIRVMEKHKPPIRVILPGRVFRREAIDPTHLPMFYQVEGLLVDEGVTFAHLKGTLEVFLRALLGEKIAIRFRPSFFPFTEPSAEVDIGCTVCRGQDPGCPVCGGTGWKELLGAGMVDPQVLKNVNIDPERYSGWAFGLGIERTAMFCYQISDMRAFYENDLRFIRQFSLK